MKANVKWCIMHYTVLPYLPGVGVHRTLFKSFSFPDEPPCQFVVFSIASDLLEAIVLFNNLFAAGVRFPATSALFGVHVGGPIFPRVRSDDDVRERPGVLPPPNKIAFARRLFEAFAESLWEIRSRFDGPSMRKGVLGSGTSAGSSEEIIRGVAFNVPQVMSCWTADGPNSSGVGEGMAGTSPNPLLLGELGLSKSKYREWRETRRNQGHAHGTPAIAASTLLRVGLGGSDRLEGVDSSCSDNLVFPCLILLGSGGNPETLFPACGDTSASGANIRAFLA